VRRIFAYVSVGLISCLWFLSAIASELPGGAVKKAPPPVGAAESCGDYGTSVHFVSTPSVAARQALKEEKLVFILHVSGLFEDPDFT